MISNEKNKEKPLSSINVLLVEDEEFSVRFVTSVLEAIGIVNITVAGNGAEALDKMAGDSIYIDIIVCDLEMPEMGGFEFIRRVRYGTVPQFKKTPILVLTGKDTDKNTDLGRIHKISGFIGKPPDVKALERHFRKILGY